MPLGTSVYFTIPLLVVSALATVGPMRNTRASASACCAAASLTVIWMIPVSLELCACAGTIVPIVPSSNARTSATPDRRLGALISCEILGVGSVLSLRTARRALCSHPALSDHRQKAGSEVGELLLSYPADRPELRRAARDLARHRAQYRVAEHDVRRHVPLGRDLAPQRPQRPEQLPIVVLGGAHGARRPCAPSGVGQRDDVVARGVLRDQA